MRFKVPMMLLVASNTGSSRLLRTSICAARCATASNFPSFTTFANSGEVTLSSWKRARAGRFSRLPEDRSSTMLTSHPSARNRSAAWEPMNPAPPVMRIVLAIIAILFGRGIVGGFSLEAEEIPRRIYYAEPSPVCGGGLQSDARLMEELVHQALRKVFDDLRLLGRHRAQPPHCRGELRRSQLVHFIPEYAHDRNSSEPGHPVPVFHHFLRDHPSRGRNILFTPLEIRSRR